MKTSYVVLAIALVLVVGFSSGLAGYTMGKCHSQAFKHQRWEKFKSYAKEHPEKFRETMDRRKEQVRERLAELKEKDPAKYREVLQEKIGRLEAVLAELKKAAAETSQR